MLFSELLHQNGYVALPVKTVCHLEIKIDTIYFINSYSYILVHE